MEDRSTEYLETMGFIILKQHDKYKNWPSAAQKLKVTERYTACHPDLYIKLIIDGEKAILSPIKEGN